MEADYSANLEAVKNLFDAIERGDTKTILRLCTEDAIFWRNYDFSETRPVDIAAGLKWLPRTFKNFRYGDRQPVLGADGSVFEQHALHGTNSKGVEINVPIIVRIHFRDGIIRLMEEYTDSVHMRSIVMEQLFAVLREHEGEFTRE